MARKTYLYTDLNSPLFICGVDYKLFVINLLFAFFLTLLAKLFYWPIMALLLHFVLLAFNRHDPSMLKIYVNYARFGNRYEPWPLPGLQRRKRRPLGFGPSTNN